MKILLLVRLYSHLVPSVINQKWFPHGMPAFYKLVERLDERGIQTDILFLCKNEIKEIDHEYSFRFYKLKHIQVFVAPLKRDRTTKLNRLRNELSHLALAWKLVNQNKYALIYCDRVNVTIGGLLARLNQKVVLRLFGVANLLEEMSHIQQRTLPSHKLLSFSAPFSHVICSKDGSPGRTFMKRYIRHTVGTEWLLNGVDPFPKEISVQDDLRQKYNISSNTKIILTTGNLEIDKAPHLFIHSIIELKNLNDNFFVFIVGAGSLRHELEMLVREQGLASYIVFTGRVPHKMIYSYLAQADIYVSLNMYGNLSNAVLEAMSAGKCIVTLKKDQVSHRDEQTDDPQLREALVLIDRKQIVETLPTVLNDLLKNPQTITQKSQKIRHYAKKTLRSWNDRIEYEVDLLCRLAMQSTR